MAGALIGALRVSLSAETSAFEAGMKRSQRQAKTTADSIKSSFGSLRGEFGLLKSGLAGFIGALSVGSIVAAGKAALDYAGSLGETAQQLGVTTRELQTFRFAAQQNGASLEEADQALGKFAVSISKAQAGSKQATAAFDAVGVSLADLQNKSKSELLGQIADKMKATGGAANNAAAGVAIFGRGFLKIVPTLDQGSAGMNELARAAEELGIVLSDSQIQKADETADKIDALQTVLKAQIAGVVADNADSILDLANAIAEVAREAAAAIGKLRAFYDEARIAANQAEIWLSKRFDAGLLGTLGIGNQNRAANQAAAQADINAIRQRQGDARFGGLFQGGRPKPQGGGGNPNRFLASGGGGSHKPKKDRSAEEALRKQLDALRDQHQFDQDILRAKQDVLQAQQSLATNADDRANVALELLGSDRRQYEAQLAYEVKVNELTKGADGITQAQADQLLELYGITESLKRQGIEQEQAQENARFVAELSETDYQIAREKLENQAALADTAAEARRAALALLDLDYRYQKAKLNAIMATEKVGSIEWERARRELAALEEIHAGRVANAKAGTRGPLESLRNELPLDPDKLNEALENVAANGLKSLEDGLLDIVTGTKSVKEAFHQMAAAILADLLRIAIQKYIIGTILKVAGVAGAADGGQVGGFAYGGFVSGPGGPREDRVMAMLSNGEFVINAKATKKYMPLLEAINSGKIPAMAMGGMAGGLPIARTPYSARAVAANDTARMPAVVMHNDFRGADPAAVAQIKAHLDGLEQRLPGQIVSTVKDASDRFILRGMR